MHYKYIHNKILVIGRTFRLLAIVEKWSFVRVKSLVACYSKSLVTCYVNLVTCHSKCLVACYVNLVACHSKCLVACYVNLVACHSKSLVAFFIVPPAVELIHFGKGEIWQQIDSMEAAYSQLIDWSPSPTVPASSSSQWGHNILVVGDPKRQSGSKVKSLIADSFGFASNGELHNVSGYLKSHGGYELEMVGSGRITLGNLL